MRRTLARIRFFALALLLILLGSSLPALAAVKSAQNAALDDSNLYRYANNNPVNFTDPTGLVPPSHDTYVNRHHFNTDAGSGKNARTATSLTIVTIAGGHAARAVYSAAYRYPLKAALTSNAVVPVLAGLAGYEGPGTVQLPVSSGREMFKATKQVLQKTSPHLRQEAADELFRQINKSNPGWLADSMEVAEDGARGWFGPGYGFIIDDAGKCHEGLLDDLVENANGVITDFSKFIQVVD